MKLTLISAAVMAALLGLSAAAQADTITVSINPDAGGVDPTISVGSLDWSVGNSIAVALPGGNLNTPTAGQQLNVFAHAGLSAFQDDNGTPIGGLNLNGITASTNYEWTFVSRFREKIDSISGTTVNTSVVANANNVFQVYYDPNPDSNNLTGKGFNNGTLILEAVGGVGGGAFTANTNPNGTIKTANLDGFGTNQYTGYTTETGQGSTTITGSIDFFDATFFPTLKLGEDITLLFTTQQVLNYQQTNPSSCFWDPTAGAFFTGAGNGISGGCGTAGDGGTIGLTGNGIPGTPGPNQMFQTDASTSFSAPEPGSLILLSGALLGLYGASRRRKG
jgi:hypothetical protein